MLSRFWYWIGRTTVAFYSLLFLQLDISPDDNFPVGPVILAANHPSIVDPAMVTLLDMRQMRILILDTLFKVPLFGRSLKWSGHIPVICGQGQAALTAGLESLQNRKTVVVFPEGEISPAGGGCHPAHTGMARLALATGLPVIPVGIALNPARIRLIHTHVKGKRETGTWYLSGPYAMSVGEAMRFSGDPADREQVRQVTAEIMQNIDQLALESRLRIEAMEHPDSAVITGARAAWEFVYRSLSALAGAKMI
jgi:1-acyl-sn-glycerol-3-phosphate acyltransferase